MLTRADAATLDANDALAGWRDEFVIPDPSLVYLDGNSLGRTPKRTLVRLAGLAGDEWAGDLIGGWSDWITLPARVGDHLATIIGARSGEVVVHDSTSVNTYQLVHAAISLRPDRRVVVVADDEFPSDRYITEAVAATRRLDVVPTVDDADLTEVAVVVRSVVDYRTAEVVDMASFTQRCTAAGALVIWDLSHAAGAIEVDLRGAGAQLAVGCTYKFLNGGPGAPGFSYVASELQHDLVQPIHGWWSHHDQFETDRPYAPHPDVRRLLIGTPPVLALAGVEEGIALTARAGIGSDRGEDLGADAVRAGAVPPVGPALADAVRSPCAAEVTSRSGIPTRAGWSRAWPPNRTWSPTSARPTSCASDVRR